MRVRFLHPIVCYNNCSIFIVPVFLVLCKVAARSRSLLFAETGNLLAAGVPL